jgi:MoaA/NifB/PqqE/SkfB family radical SAM enzyme
MSHALPSLRAATPRLGRWRWLRHGPFLAQLVVVRRCNLSCTYCTEYDQHSPPLPLPALVERLEHLWRLRTWAVCLTGGEPSLHPALPELIEHLQRLRFRRRMLITNGTRLSAAMIADWNTAGHTDLQLSIDGVTPSATTHKVLDLLRPKLELLAQHARFRVVLTAVLGSAPPGEAAAGVAAAKAFGFTPRVLLVHDAAGGLALAPDERAAHLALAQLAQLNRGLTAGYRRALLERGRAPFKCRAGARYLYVDEHGRVAWCSQTRAHFGADLATYGDADLRAQFASRKPCHATCTLGCARTASAVDGWRPQSAPVAPV